MTGWACGVADHHGWFGIRLAGRAVTFRATGLPGGLTISSPGVISGTPTTAGIYTVVVTATDSAGVTGSTTFRYTIYRF